MNTTQEINLSLRNGLLVKAIASVDLGLHLLNMKHSPIIITYDWKYQIGAIVKDYDIILMKSKDEPIYTLNLLNVYQEDIEELRKALLDTMILYKQLTPIWVLTKYDLFLTGFNHHNKIDKRNPYPVFAKYDPIIYYDKESATKTAIKHNLEFYLIDENENSNSFSDNNSI